MTAPLSELCRDRSLLTPELHSSNDFYGHARLLRRYCGWSSGASLKVAIEHGVTFNEYLWDIDLNTRMPVFLCGSANHARQYEEKTGDRRRAFGIGPMISYAASFTAEAAPAARTLLAFPSHSTHRVAAAFDADAFADLLEQEGKAYSRVVVCVYWKDYLSGAAATFEKRGFVCTSAGHMYDPHFLFRLIEIIRGATAVVTNEIGSCLLYATLLGRPAWLKRQDIEYRATKNALDTDVPEFLSHPNVQRCFELFRTPSDTILPQQRQYVDDLTGQESFRSPRELHEILLDAETSYRREVSLKDRAKDAVRRAVYLGRSFFP